MNALANELGKAAGRKEKILQVLLRIAHHNKEPITLDDTWRNDTMRAIRKLARQGAESAYTKLLEGFLWRLSPLTAVMVVVLGLIFLRYELIPDKSLFQLFVAESNDLNLLPLITF